MGPKCSLRTKLFVPHLGCPYIKNPHGNVGWAISNVGEQLQALITFPKTFNTVNFWFGFRVSMAQLEAMDRPQLSLYTTQGWSVSSCLLKMLDSCKWIQVSPFVMNSPYILAHTPAFSHSLGLNQGWHGECNRWAPLMMMITKGLAVERWAWEATNGWMLILMGVLPFWIPDEFDLALILRPCFFCFVFLWAMCADVPAHS